MKHSWQKHIINVERQLNEQIKQKMDDKKIMNLAKLKMFEKQQMIKSLRDQFESVATLMNIPTKRDIANLSKIAKQIEEKLDNLEEKWIILGSPSMKMKRVTLKRRSVRPLWQESDKNCMEDEQKFVSEDEQNARQKKEKLKKLMDALNSVHDMNLESIFTKG